MPNTLVDSLTADASNPVIAGLLLKSIREGRIQGLDAPSQRDLYARLMVAQGFNVKTSQEGAASIAIVESRDTEGRILYVDRPWYHAPTIAGELKPVSPPPIESQYGC